MSVASFVVHPFLRRLARRRRKKSFVVKCHTLVRKSATPALAKVIHGPDVRMVRSKQPSSRAALRWVARWSGRKTRLETQNADEWTDLAIADSPATSLSRSTLDVHRSTYSGVKLNDSAKVAPSYTFIAVIG